MMLLLTTFMTIARTMMIMTTVIIILPWGMVIIMTARIRMRRIMMVRMTISSTITNIDNDDDP